MNRSVLIVLSLIVISSLLLTGCNLPITVVVNTNKTQEATSTPELPTATVQMEQPTAQPAMDTETPAPHATAAPENTAEPTQIVHSAIPTDSYYESDQIAVDCNTGARLPSGSTQINVSGCDYWNREYLERPADSNGGTYVPALDILWSQVGKASPWVYLRTKVTSLADEPAGYQTGFEIDTNLDSRGNFLVLASEPKSTQWTTDGVQVWQDTNNDVGGAKSFAYDQNQSNGYETELFNAGVGSDPDLAWVRVSPKDSTIVEFAVKASILGEAKTFAWWSWTGIQKLSPAQFEVVDRLQDADAWNMDNSCSWIYGTKPEEGQVANLCAIVKPTPTPTLPPNEATTCPVKPCPILSFWDPATCTCKRFIIIIPTKTPIIIN